MTKETLNHAYLQNLRDESKNVGMCESYGYIALTWVYVPGEDV